MRMLSTNWSRIAAGKVRAPDAVLENQIAAEANSRLCTVKDHMAGSVPGSVAHFKDCLPQPKDLSVLEIDARLRSGVDLESKQRRPAFRPPQAYGRRGARPPTEAD